MLPESHGANKHECPMSISMLDTQDPDDLLRFLAVAMLRKSTGFGVQC